jgi:hypothetical protein
MNILKELDEIVIIKVHLSPDIDVHALSLSSPIAGITSYYIIPSILLTYGNAYSEALCQSY